MRRQSILAAMAVVLLAAIPTVTEATLIASWNFDERSGTTAFDSAGSNDGVVHGAQWVDGLLDGALNFDGVDDYVEIPDSDSLNPYAGLTVSAWVYIDAISWSDRTAVVCKYYWKGDGGRGDRAYMVELGKNNQPDNSTVGSAVAEVPTLPGHPIYGTTQLEAAQWYHIAATFSPGHQRIYVNGLQEAYDSGAGVPDSLPNNHEPVYIGHDRDERTYFNGIIDEVRI